MLHTHCTTFWKQHVWIWATQAVTQRSFFIFFSFFFATNKTLPRLFSHFHTPTAQIFEHARSKTINMDLDVAVITFASPSWVWREPEDNGKRKARCKPTGRRPKGSEPFRNSPYSWRWSLKWLLDASAKLLKLCRNGPSSPVLSLPTTEMFFAILILPSPCSKWRCSIPPLKSDSNPPWQFCRQHNPTPGTNTSDLWVLKFAH